MHYAHRPSEDPIACIRPYPMGCDPVGSLPCSFLVSFARWEVVVLSFFIIIFLILLVDGGGDWSRPADIHQSTSNSARDAKLTASFRKHRAPKTRDDDDVMMESKIKVSGRVQLTTYQPCQKPVGHHPWAAQKDRKIPEQFLRDQDGGDPGCNSTLRQPQDWAVTNLSAANSVGT